MKEGKKLKNTNKIYFTVIVEIEDDEKKESDEEDFDQIDQSEIKDSVGAEPTGHDNQVSLNFFLDAISLLMTNLCR